MNGSVVTYSPRSLKKYGTKVIHLLGFLLYVRGLSEKFVDNLLTIQLKHRLVSICIYDKCVKNKDDTLATYLQRAF